MIRASLAAGSIALIAASPAIAGQRKSITPYIELGQVLTGNLQTGDVLTYSTASAGVDAVISARNIEVQLSYNYQHNFSWDDRYGDDDLHSGLARATVRVAPGLSIEGGALATRARSDIRGAAPTVLVGSQDNVTQIYSAYVRPSVTTRAGAANLNASYRFGYTKVEAPGATGVAPNSPRLDAFDDSTNHLVQASVGVIRANDKRRDSSQRVAASRTLKADPETTGHGDRRAVVDCFQGLWRHDPSH